MGCTKICAFSVNQHAACCKLSAPHRQQWVLNATASSCIEPADRKRGQRKGPTSKKSQTVSIQILIFFDNFRTGQKTSNIVKKYQKRFSTLFDHFLRGTKFPAPLKGSEQKETSPANSCLGLSSALSEVWHYEWLYSAHHDYPHRDNNKRQIRRI